MKKLLTVTITMFMVIFVLSFVVNAKLGNEVAVTLNGEAIDFADQAPAIVEGRVLVPLRAIFEALGASVEWEQKTKTVTSTKNSTTVVMTVGDNTIYRNGEKVLLDVPAQIINSRTMVPARAIAEAFGIGVEWDNVTRTVVLETEETGDETDDSNSSNEGDLSDSKKNKYVSNFNSLKNTILKSGKKDGNINVLTLSYTNYIAKGENVVNFRYDESKKEIQIEFNRMVDGGTYKNVITLPEEVISLEYDFAMEVTINKKTNLCCQGLIKTSDDISIEIISNEDGENYENYVTTWVKQDIENLTEGMISMYLGFNYNIKLDGFDF